MTLTAKDYTFILASKSPRRQMLFKELGFPFTVELRETEETYPQEMPVDEIPAFLAQKKALAFRADELLEKQIVLTADTLVLLDNKVLGKPKDEQDAIAMLQSLSGRMHRVITGICLKSKTKEKTFSVETKVFFRKLNLDEIKHYITHYQPYDKAGSYGIQEWIGYVGVERVEGSYFNVMGLPTQQLYITLKTFLSE